MRAMMPSFSYITTVRSPLGHDPDLELHARHVLFAQSASEPVLHAVHRFPENVNIIVASKSELAISIAGVVNDVEVSCVDIAQSGVARHLQEYLTMNASQLNFHLVSEIQHCEDGSLPMLRLSIHPAGGISPIQPHVTLTALNLTYRFQTAKRSSQCANRSIFSAKLALPIANVLNKVVNRFVALHLVRRYPLIFGSSPKQFALEMAYSMPIVQACLKIVKRSGTSTFRQMCQIHIQGLKDRRESALESASIALSRFLASYGDDTDLEAQRSEHANLRDDEVLNLSMEMHLRTSMQPLEFKSSTGRGWDSDEEDIIVQDVLPKPPEMQPQQEESSTFFDSCDTASDGFRCDDDNWPAEDETLWDDFTERHCRDTFDSPEVLFPERHTPSTNSLNSLTGPLSAGLPVLRTPCLSLPLLHQYVNREPDHAVHGRTSGVGQTASTNSLLHRFEGSFLSLTPAPPLTSEPQFQERLTIHSTGCHNLTPPALDGENFTPDIHDVLNVDFDEDHNGEDVHQPALCYADSDADKITSPMRREKSRLQWLAEDWIEDSDFLGFGEVL